MNELNMNLHKQRTIFRDQLKDNQLKDQKVDNYVRNYQKEKNSRLKYKGVRMIKSALNSNRNISPLNNNNYNGLINNYNISQNKKNMYYFNLEAGRPQSPFSKSNITSFSNTNSIINNNNQNLSLKLRPNSNIRNRNLSRMISFSGSLPGVTNMKNI